jgi:hypothetical protein
MTSPLFLLSLPRAGSTVVQRVLAAHEGIATASEPWLLLPQLYARRLEGIYTEYGQLQSTKALADFATALPGGEEEYAAELRRFVSRLYDRASTEGTVYFLDKTPRYYLVVEELFRVFPDARFVFLWRNPLAVLASIIETWAHGKWSFGWWRMDLFEGVAALTGAYGRHAEQAHAVRYEDLLDPASVAWPDLFAYLHLPFDPGALERFQETDLGGRMGDPTGQRFSGSLSTEPIERWKATIANPFRKAWCRRYLRWMGRERLAVMGYDLDALLVELAALPSGTHLMLSDLIRAAYGWRTRRWRDRALRKLITQARW